VAISRFDKLMDLVFTGLLVRWIPASGKNGFSQIHGSASFLAVTLKKSCLKEVLGFLMVVNSVIEKRGGHDFFFIRSCL
jgi:hypothetical protein